MTSLPSGFGVEAEGGERLRFSDAEFVVRASADTTGGAFCIVDHLARPVDGRTRVRA
jgi:hypothetical protein